MGMRGRDGGSEENVGRKDAVFAGFLAFGLSPSLLSNSLMADKIRDSLLWRIRSGDAPHK